MKGPNFIVSDFDLMAIADEFRKQAFNTSDPQVYLKICDIILGYTNRKILSLKDRETDESVNDG